MSLLKFSLMSLVFFQFQAHAQFDDLKFKQALKLKKDYYLTEGVFTGGDQSSQDFTITNVRVAANPAGYDRVVIDLSGNELGEKTPLKRPPFYWVEINPTSKKVIITLFGKPKLDFSTLSSIQAAKKTRFIDQIEFTPLANQDRWTWALHTHKAARVEAFELTDPARIIIDLKN